MPDPSSPISYRLDDRVAVVSMDDGKANAIAPETLSALHEALDRAEGDGAHALLITGREGKFCAGFDLAEMTASTERMRALVADGARFLCRLYGLGIPTVAACGGHALAAGALMLLACDHRIGADVPAKIGLNEVVIGMPLPIFAVEFARDRLAPRLLSASTVTGRLYDPAGAAGVGYLDRVVAAEELESDALDDARTLSQLRSGAVAETKKNLRQASITHMLDTLDADIAHLTGPTS